MTRRRRGGIKSGESKPANHFPMCSPVWIPQRCSQGYTEKRRGWKDTEVARGIKGEIKRREKHPASNQFPKCSPQYRTNKKIQSWVEKRMGEGGDRGDRVEKKEIQSG